MVGAIIAIIGGACAGVGLSRTLVARRERQRNGIGIALVCVGVVALVIGLVLAASM